MALERELNRALQERLDKQTDDYEKAVKESRTTADTASSDARKEFAEHRKKTARLFHAE